MQKDFGQFRVEPPGLKIPMALILDDPAPCRNAMYFHGGFRGHVAEIPNSFLSAFCDIAERTGMSGKFTLLPYPFGLGRIDRRLAGVPDTELAEFLALVRERIVPRFDISSEILTHWNALDLQTMTLLPWWEREWVSWQSRETLTDYISLSLEILNQVETPANGVTSPWDTGSSNEDDYAWAIGAAARRVNGQQISWYFLHEDSTSAQVPVQLWHLNRQLGAAVAGIVVCSGDALWNTQRGEQAQIDRWIRADGSGGRLVEACSAGGIVAFCTHWQSLFSNGTWAGLRALEEAANRINIHLGKRTRWMRCSDIARYATTTACLAGSIEYDEPDAVSVRLQAPVHCNGYTISMPLPLPGRHGVTIEQHGQTEELVMAASDDSLLQPGTWREWDGRLAVCWDFPGDTLIRIRSL